MLAMSFEAPVGPAAMGVRSSAMDSVPVTANDRELSPATDAAKGVALSSTVLTRPVLPMPPNTVQAKAATRHNANTIVQAREENELRGAAVAATSVCQWAFESQRVASSRDARDGYVGASSIGAFLTIPRTNVKRMRPIKKEPARFGGFLGHVLREGSAYCWAASPSAAAASPSAAAASPSAAAWSPSAWAASPSAAA